MDKAQCIINIVEDSEVGGGYALPPHEGFGEAFGGFYPRRGGARPETERRLRRTEFLKPVGETQRKGKLWSNDDQVDVVVEDGL